MDQSTTQPNIPSIPPASNLPDIVPATIPLKTTTTTTVTTSTSLPTPYMPTTTTGTIAPLPIPTQDPTTSANLAFIINKEINFEIHLKHRLINDINRQLRICEYLQGIISDSVHDRSTSRQIPVELLNMANSVAGSQSGSVINSATSVVNSTQISSVTSTPAELTDSYYPQRSTRRTRPSNKPIPNKNAKLYMKDSDGRYIKIVCRYCQSEKFQNLQGVVNHTRIAHSVFLSSHYQAVNEFKVKLVCVFCRTLSCMTC